MFIAAQTHALPNAVDLSARAEPYWQPLSPFHLYERPCIPVPGTFDSGDVMGKTFMCQSRSVEAIWQGLKQIRGVRAPEMFQQLPRSRAGHPEGYWFGYRLLNQAEAKALVYIPSYLHVLRSLEHQRLDELRLLADGQDLALFDSSLPPTGAADHPMSHLELLVDFLNGQLEPYESAATRLSQLARDMRTARQTECVSSWIAPFEQYFIDRLQALKMHELSSYADCANLFEREVLILTLVRNTGNVEDIEPAGRVLQKWIQQGVLSVAQASTLSTMAPVGRWLDRWWNASAASAQAEQNPPP